MIVPSRRLKSLVETYTQDRKILCERVGCDESMLSLLMAEKRSPSPKMMEKFCQFTGLSLGDLWDIADGKEED